MSKMSDSIIDVPVNDTDYDYVKEQDRMLNGILEDLDTDVMDMMVGQEEEEKDVGDTLSFSPEED